MKSLSTKPQTRLILLFVFFFSLTAILKAETPPAIGVLKGRVTDVNMNPVEYATASIVNPKTNEIVKGEVCNGNGEFTISKINQGEYILSVSMVGYERNESEKIVITRKNSLIEKNIVLKESTQQLKDLVVVARKQFIEQSVDKTIINPDASITSASENVYEILRKLPGVTIDNNENITLKGKQGVQILIDEKPTYVSADQLANMLKGMQGKNVDKIEIIENPSAKYDAEGNSGIINIKTKHNKAPGFNGNVFAGLTFTRTLGENAGLDLNMNFGKLNVYGNYAFYDWKGWHSMDATRNFTSAELLGATQKIFSESNNNGNAHNYKVGSDYYISKKQVLSFMVSGNTGFNHQLETGNTSFFDKYSQMDSTLNNNTERNNYWNNQTVNLNYKWDIDTTGRSLTVDADYAHFYFYSKSDQKSTYFDKLGNDLNRDVALNTTQNAGIDIITAKVDYVHPVNKIYNFETGVKTSFVKTESGAAMIGYINQDDRFIYTENIQAAYINGSAKYSKTSLQLGLRLENTNSVGNSVATNQIDKRSYLKLFPSVFIQQTLKPEQTIGLRYSYRIGRPSYHVLNPFVWMIDPFTYNQGNPLLKPQFTHAVSLNHNYKGMLMTSIGYNYTMDLFTEVLYQIDETKTVYQTMENLGNSKDINASESFQFQPAKWWHLNGTITGMYKEVNSALDAGVQFKRWSYTGNMTNTFTLPYKIGMELSAYYSSKQLIGNFTILPRYSVDLGIQKKVLNDNGTVKVAFSDIFNTGSAGAYTKYGNIDISVQNKWETRRLNISFNYRFGKNDFKTRANRSTSSSEEQSRSGK